jgi:hypothetical protein
MKRILLPFGNNYNFALCSVPSSDYYYRNSENSKTLFLQFTEAKNHRNHTPVIPEWNTLLKDNHIADIDLCKKEISHAEFQDYLRKKYGVANRYKSTHSIWIWIAATSLIIIFAIVSVFNHLKLNDASVLFNQYYKTPAITELVSNAYLFNDINLRLSAHYFNKGDFTSAGDYSNIVPQASSGFYASKLLFAICLIENNKYLEALENLNLLSKTSGFVPYFQWYSGLCNLKLGRISNAKYFFNEVNNSNHFLQKNAAKILKELETLH